MSIKAIETWYAGHKFRSRLEARWAVFFDALGIKWEYEAQGFHVSHRLTGKEGAFQYLPDFWLPDLGLWAEVKGALTEAECVRLLDAAASLSSNDGGGCHDKGGNDLLILGQVETIRWPWRLHMHKGGLFATPWDPGEHGSGCPKGDGIEVAADYGVGSCAIHHHDAPCCSPGELEAIAHGSPWSVNDICERLLKGKIGYVGGLHGRALIKAKSARFEFGQSGATL